MRIEAMACWLLPWAAVRASDFDSCAIIPVWNESADSPAIYSVNAVWEVPYTIPRPDVDLLDALNRPMVSHWIGIAGGGCAATANGFVSAVTFQAGTSSYFLYDGSNVTHMGYAWYEWLPAASIPVSQGNMTAMPGERVNMTLTALGATRGNVYMENLSTGKSWTQDVTYDLLQPTELCVQNGSAYYDIEWINASGDNKGNVPLFSNLTFTDVRVLSDSASLLNMSTQANLNNLTSGGTLTAVVESLGDDKVRFYSPEGKDWVPPQG